MNYSELLEAMSRAILKVGVLKGRCHGGQPLVSFPPVLAFNPNNHRLAIWLVPARLKPSTGLLGLVRYLGVVTWSIGKAGGGSCDGLRGHRVKDTLATYI